MDRAVGIGRNNMKILSDNEFVSMVEKWGNSRLDQMFLELRKEGFVTKTATLTGADKQVTVTLEAVPATPPPVVQPVEAKDIKTDASEAKNQVGASEQKKTGGQLLWIVGGAIIAVAGLVFFLIKRKKQ